MNIDKIDLNLLKIFVAIYKEEKLTLASDRLGLTQPALSHALKRLRDILDDTLFERTPHGMRATNPAHDFYARIKPGLSALDQGLSGDQAFDPATSDKTFLLGLNDYSTAILLPPLLRHINRLSPGITIHTRPTTAQTNADLLAGDIDLAMVQAGDTPPWAAQELLTTETLIGVSAKDNDNFGRKIDLMSYAKAPHVTCVSDKLENDWIDGSLAGQDKARQICHKVSHYADIANLVQNGRLIGTLPKRIAKQLSAAYGLKTFTLPFKPPPHKIIQLWHRRNQNDAANKWLREQIGCVATFL